MRYAGGVGESQRLVLGADVGGTSARFAILRANPTTWPPLHLQVVPTATVASFAEALGQVQHSGPGQLAAACIAVAGPVRGDRARLTNLPWEVDVATVAAQLSLPNHRVRLVNDVEALAWAIPTLAAHDLYTLHPGQPAFGNAALLAVGTGLGEAGLIWDEGGYHVFASEGGHADFAPRDEVEWGFARQVMGRWGHASWERALSGPGLVDLYHYLVELRGARVPPLRRDGMGVKDPAAAVTAAALAGSCPLAVEAVHRFAGLLGAEAGNWALKLLARGGVYVGGGIPPKLLPHLDSRLFLESFFDKGRMRPLLETFPVYLIRDDNAGLRGAAAVASRLAVGGERSPGQHPA